MQTTILKWPDALHLVLYVIRSTQPQGYTQSVNRELRPQAQACASQEILFVKSLDEVTVS